MQPLELANTRPRIACRLKTQIGTMRETRSIIARDENTAAAGRHFLAVEGDRFVAFVDDLDVAHRKPLRQVTIATADNE